MSLDFKKFILESSKNSPIWYIFDVPITIEDKISNNIDLFEVSKTIEKLVPLKFIELISEIKIGNFEVLLQRSVNALYHNGVIYISSNQSSDNDLIDDIVHEIAHAVEERYTDAIYGDGKIEQEFLGKREQLWDIMVPSYGDRLNINHFRDPNLNVEFDQFLYNDVGYDNLNYFINGIFLTPYSVVSIREYFATGFEFITFRKNLEYFLSICPKLYMKVKNELEEMK